MKFNFQGGRGIFQGNSRGKLLMDLWENFSPPREFNLEALDMLNITINITSTQNPNIVQIVPGSGTSVGCVYRLSRGQSFLLAMLVYMYRA